MIQTLGKSLVLVVLFGWTSSTWAGLEPSEIKSLKEILGRYQKSPMVEVALEKKVTSEILGREKVHRGQSYLALKRFRLETFEPEKTLIVYDGSTLWNVQYPPQGDSTPIQVAKAKLDTKTQNQILLGDLLVGQGLVDKFDFVRGQQRGDDLEVLAKPKQSHFPVSELTIKLSLKNKLIRSIAYTDDIGNQIEMNLSDTKFLKKKNSKLFQYVPEKGAQVTEL